MNEAMKLKTCPFCGGEVRIQGRGNETNDYRVYCKACGCSTMMWMQSEEKAVEAWNRRPTLPENKALTVEELRGMDGQPVWVETTQEWRIICVDSENGFVRLYTVFNTISAEHVLDDDGRIYRRPPEKE